jgi:hypothetical protein
VSTAVDQETADGVIAAVEQSLRAEGFSVTCNNAVETTATKVPSVTPGP